VAIALFVSIVDGVRIVRKVRKVRKTKERGLIENMPAEFSIEPFRFEFNTVILLSV